jgi:hypothetical protein
MIIALTIGMMGCDNANVEIKSTDYIIEANTIRLKIVVIDNCEYLYRGTGGAVLTHKGNCNNPIHKHNGGQDE